MDQPLSGNISRPERDSSTRPNSVTNIRNVLIRPPVQNGQGHLHSMEEQVPVARRAGRVLPAALL